MFAGIIAEASRFTGMAQISQSKRAGPYHHFKDENNNLVLYFNVKKHIGTFDGRRMFFEMYVDGKAHECHYNSERV